MEAPIFEEKPHAGIVSECLFNILIERLINCRV